MDTPGLPESLRRRVAERSSLEPIHKVRALLHGYVADAGDFDEIRAELGRTARVNDFHLRQYLVALDLILAAPQRPGTLLRLVEGDANWGIDHDQTDAGAAVFLREVFETLRSVIDQETSGLPEPLRRRVAEVAAMSAPETVSEFLGGYFADADSLRKSSRSCGRSRSPTPRDPPLFGRSRCVSGRVAVHTGDCPRLVGWEANWVLEDPSDAGAAQFLRAVADMLRAIPRGARI